jgi:hypothetical protein
MGEKIINTRATNFSALETYPEYKPPSHPCVIFENPGSHCGRPLHPNNNVIIQGGKGLQQCD